MQAESQTKAGSKTKSTSLTDSIAQAEAELEALTAEASNAQETSFIDNGNKDGFDDAQAVLAHQ